MLSILTDPLVFWVPGQPQPKQRPRTVRLQQNGRVVTYTPRATADFERTVSIFAVQAMRRAGWRAPAELDRFALSVVLHFSDLRRRDCDNVLKAVQDGLQPVLILDDWQIVSSSVSRVMSSSTPGARVTLTRVSETFFSEVVP